MKTIGLLGGMSWESTASYYRIINEEIKHRLGGLHSGKIVLNSVDFQPIEALQHQGNWEQTAQLLTASARSVESAGADFLLICTNTMHKVAPQVAEGIGIPLLHIADATGRRITQRGMGRVALLGTRFTMEESFYRGRLEEVFGLDVLVPDAEDRETVHRVIYDELCVGRIEKASRERFLAIIDTLSRRGAEAVILGCTEIALLVGQADTPVNLLDTTRIHALSAVDECLREDTGFGIQG
ncbi:MAG: aspartate/glutamate racemase family protein [Gammaproteobacteria bacterium]|nr:aspartate/glutamate racemase family protein [Gammaproteobacteria bacterium]